MQIDVGNAIYLYKELFLLPTKTYKIERAMEYLETFIQDQLQELEPPPSKPAKPSTDDEIPF